ncbi:peptide chain release factor N(5)-glutamine methyltransferase [Marinilabiliaceae bacterium JC017]|nr:peptide chain release factor N(5)-glutamine methyltransferase [Marinilabiliaceae bacterium JC017]
MTGKSVTQVIQTMQQELKELYPSSEIRQFARLLFEHLLGFTSTDLMLKGDTKLTDSQLNYLQDCLSRLKKSEPIQYIIGDTEFMGLSFQVNPAVLIPRPETEELVDWITTSHQDSGLSVLDIGTGSGCIAIAVGHGLNEAQMEAWDISEQALETAKENARANDVKVCFRLKDALKDHCPDRQYDIIVSNPPYIRHLEKEQMHANVLDYEPHTALFVADNEALIFYENIAVLGITHLKPGGWLYFEINEGFGTEMQQLLQAKGYENITLRKDLSGKNRMIRGQRPC